MVTLRHPTNRIELIIRDSDLDMVADSLLDLSDAIQSNEEPPLNDNEAVFVLGKLSSETDSSVAFALWTLLWHSSLNESEVKFAIQTVHNPSAVARLGAARLLEVKYPEEFEKLAPQWKDDSDSNVAFRASLVAYRENFELLLSRVIELLPDLSFDNFDDAIELLERHGNSSHNSRLAKVFGDHARIGEIRDLIERLKRTKP